MALVYFCCIIELFDEHYLFFTIFFVKVLVVYFSMNLSLLLVMRTPKIKKNITCILSNFFFFCSHYSPPILAPKPPNFTHYLSDFFSEDRFLNEAYVPFLGSSFVLFIYLYSFYFFYNYLLYFYYLSRSSSSK